jgi:hypothetical protein
LVPRRLAVILASLILIAPFDRVARAWQVPPTEPPSAETTKTAATTPIEQRPYRIRAFVSFDPMTRIDARGRDRLVDEWLGLARRLIGPAWEVEVVESDGAASSFVLDDVAPAVVRPLGDGVDKVWLIQGKPLGGSIVLQGRELDVATGWLGSPHARKVTLASELPRDLFRLSQDMFAPYAEMGASRAEIVSLRVQGSALPHGSAGDAIAPPASVFRPVRVFYKDDGSVLEIMKVNFTYLVVQGQNGATTETTLITKLRDPLTNRYSRKNRLIALGVKPGAFATRFRFINTFDKQPAAGFVLTYRTIPQGQARELATTDRDGRVQLPPGFSDGLVMVRLISGHLTSGPNAGRSEPLGEVPIMPGETADEMTVPIDPHPHALTLETQLDALRDSIVDLILVRKRLEARMKAREQGDDWNGVGDVLVEYRKLTPRDVFLKRLEKLTEDAQKQEERTKSVVLTRNARAQVADTRSLLDRYLDDEVFRAYEDAVARAKERDAKPKAKPATKVATKPQAKPEPAPPAKEQAAPPPANTKKKAAEGVVPF